MEQQDTHYDAFNLLCGSLIGSGMTRKVFACNINKDLVVKVESESVRSHFQNIIEWYVWNRVCGTAYEKWFAPVHEMAPDGRVLLMHRTQPIADHDLPEKMPSFFTDFKPSNFGWLKGTIVCHDYGSNLLTEVGMTKRMRKVDWRMS